MSSKSPLVHCQIDIVMQKDNKQDSAENTKNTVLSCHGLTDIVFDVHGMGKQLDEKGETHRVI